MPEWEAPGKLNLSLLVRPRRSDGLHPLRSLAQTIQWVDRLEIEEADSDELAVEGAGLETDDNLVWRAAQAVGAERPSLRVVLHKALPVAAGLGGGSSDAAAVLAALATMLRLESSTVSSIAASVGADVPFFLRGGTAWMEGAGERITPIDPLEGFALAVLVPPFELPTPDVFRRWDELGGPVGEEFPQRALPPSLRRDGPFRNDLTPAAVSLRPELADWIAEVGRLWETPVALTGSGPSLFGFFPSVSEAEEAARSRGDARAAWGGEPRAAGVSEVA